jgi:hypothetical protein
MPSCETLDRSTANSPASHAPPHPAQSQERHAPLLAFGRDRHGVADGDTVQGDGAVAAGHGGTEFGDWLTSPGFELLSNVPGTGTGATGYTGADGQVSATLYPKIDMTGAVTVTVTVTVTSGFGSVTFTETVVSR